MKKQIITLVFAAMALFVFADKDSAKSANPGKSPVQKISLTGKIIDFNSGEALAGVEVKLDGTDLKTYTDFDGKFSFKDIKPSTYSIVASFISYDKSLVENFKASKESNKVNIKLQPSK